MPQSHAIHSQQKAYVTPQLKRYGSVQALTAGGAGSVSELNVPPPWTQEAQRKCANMEPFNQHSDYRNCN